MSRSFSRVAHSSSSRWCVSALAVIPFVAPLAWARTDRVATRSGLELTPALARQAFDPPSPHLAALARRAAPDTIFFGGTDASGLAIQGGAWDFEDGTMQGWTTTDLTDIGVFFRRVKRTDFATDPEDAVIHGDASLWVGKHEPEAAPLCWPGGQGYGNDWRMWAEKTFTYGGTGSVSVGFDYFQDSEAGFDFTYVYAIVGGVKSAPLNTSAHPDANGYGYSGDNQFAHDGLGSPSAPANDLLTIAPADLPSGAGPFQLRFEFDSDPLLSDALDSSGLHLNSWYGPFGVDDIQLSGVALGDFDTFELDAEGWTFFSSPAIGAFADVVPLADVEPVEDPCHCPLTSDPSNDYVLMAANRTGVGYPHPEHQFEEIASPPAFVGPGSAAEDLTRRLLLFDVWQDLPLSDGVGYRLAVHYYPWTCPETGFVGWTLDPAGEGGYVFNGVDGATCTSFLDDVSAFVPAAVDSLRFVLRLLSECDDFGGNCTGPEGTNPSPYWDNLRLALTSTGADAPPLAHGISQYQDIGPTSNSLAHTATAKMVSFYDTNRSDGDPTNAHMGDSTVVLAGSAAGRGTQVFLNLRVYPGPGINTSGAAWLVWRNDARFVAGSEPLAPSWAQARMDTAEAGTVRPGLYASYFWPNGQENKNTSKILPNGLFTPGTTIEYFYTSRYDDGPPSDRAFLPDTSGGFFYEVEVLPSYRRSTAGGPVLVPCVLYVDAFGAGAQEIIEKRGLKPRLGTQADWLGRVRNRWDRYDYSGAQSGICAPMAREPMGDNGITKFQSYAYRTILYNTGSAAIEGLRNGDADLLINWLTNDDHFRDAFKKGLWLSGDGMASILDRLVRPANRTLFTTYAASLLPSEEPYREQSGDSSACVRLDPAVGADFGAAASYASLAGNGCPTVNRFQVLEPIAAAGGHGNLSYADQDGGGSASLLASVSSGHFSVPQGNWAVVLDAFSLHWMRATPAGWTGSDCGADTSFVGASIATRVGEVFDWMGVPAGPALLKDIFCLDCVFSVEESSPGAPHTRLFQNVPNPFNPRTSVRYVLGVRAHVSLEIYDAAGRLVRALLDRVEEPGERAVEWDGRTDAGVPTESGVYWARLRTGDGYRAATKLVLLK